MVLREHFRIKETSVWITADEKKHIEVAKDELIRQRRELERFIRWHPLFMLTLERYEFTEKEWGEMPEVARRMVKATEIFNIGPMAAVAGTLAELAVERMRDAGASFAIVDNGGDIAILADREVFVGIYAGESPFSGKIAIKVKPSNAIVGVCTSSATVGHSISFGCADAATVISDCASLADAAATALCNAVKGRNSLENAFSILKDARIHGALVILGKFLASWGNVEIVPSRCQESSSKRRKERNKAVAEGVKA
ncbi:MAG: UPF0280 family protein [Candidatus Methanospirare jalkutatii]|nr:MAG: UPF0280 family protein [Candidatus Methanospirare jalkutatii]UYZ40374.1 MAG: UPF0280 family protein [Candidatus Methanospirare jalkutatii]